MIFYGDESGIDGNSAYVYVGGMLSDEAIHKNILKSELIKKFKKLPVRAEYKYSDKDLDQKIKNKVIQNIHKSFKMVSKKKKYDKENISQTISKMLAEIVDEYGVENEVFEIIYDKTTHKVTKESIEKYSKGKQPFQFKMMDSRNSYGVQCADWVVGDARYTTENSQK